MGRTSLKLNALHGFSAASSDEKDKDFIQVIAKAAEVLRVFSSAQERLGNQEIARRTGLPRSSVSRLTYTLSRIGYLTYLPADLKYKIGNGIFALASTAAQGLQFRYALTPTMQLLADRSEATVSIAYRDGLSMVYLHQTRSERAVSTHAHVGAKVPLARTALGRAYMLSLSAQDRDAALREVALADAAEAGRLDQWLRANADSYRRWGFAISCGEWVEYINAVAVPLWSPQHATHFVFSVAGLAAQLTQDKLETVIGPQLVAMCSEVSPIINTVADSIVGGPYV